MERSAVMPIDPDTLAQITGALIVGIGGTHVARRIRQRVNGTTDADKICSAIREEGKENRELARDHHDALVRALSEVKQDTAVTRAFVTKGNPE